MILKERLLRAIHKLLVHLVLPILCQFEAPSIHRQMSVLLQQQKKNQTQQKAKDQKQSTFGLPLHAEHVICLLNGTEFHVMR